MLGLTLAASLKLSPAGAEEEKETLKYYIIVAERLLGKMDSSSDRPSHRWPSPINANQDFFQIWEIIFWSFAPSNKQK